MLKDYSTAINEWTFIKEINNAIINLRVRTHAKDKKSRLKNEIINCEFTKQKLLQAKQILEPKLPKTNPIFQIKYNFRAR